MDSKVPPIVIAKYAPAFTTIISTPFLPTSYPKAFNAGPSFTDLLLYLGASVDTLYQILIVRSFQIGPAVKAAVLSLSRVLMVMALGVIVRSEAFPFFHGVGACVLLASITIVIVRKNRPRTRAQVSNRNQSDSWDSFFPLELGVNPLHDCGILLIVSRQRRACS